MRHDREPDHREVRLDSRRKDVFFLRLVVMEKFKSDPERYLRPPDKAAASLVSIAANSANSGSSGNKSSRNDGRGRTSRDSDDYVCPMCPGVRAKKPGPCPSCGMALERELPAAAGVEYTCPMHPQIVRAGPEACPICGMALESRTITATEDNSELREMTRRFWISLALHHPSLCHRYGRHVFRFAPSARLASRMVAVGSISPGDSRGPVGRFAILSAWMDLHLKSLYQHVYADRDGHRGHLWIQRRCDTVSANLSVFLSLEWNHPRLL